MPDHVNVFTGRGVVTQIFPLQRDNSGRDRRIVAFDFADKIGRSGHGSVCVMYGERHLPPADLAVGDVCDVQFRVVGLYGKQYHESQITCVLTGGRLEVVRERAQDVCVSEPDERDDAPDAHEETPEEFAARLVNMKRSRDGVRRQRD